MQEDDLVAGQRLRAAVIEAFGKPGLVRNDNQLSKQSGISRSVLDGWWTGVQPTPVNMRRLAEALGVEPETLWLRWLGYDVPEPGLARIADEIEALRLVISAAGGDDEQLQAARLAIDAARADPPGGPADDPPSGLGASSRPRRPDAETPRRSRR